MCRECGFHTNINTKTMGQYLILYAKSHFEGNKKILGPLERSLEKYQRKLGDIEGDGEGDGSDGEDHRKDEGGEGNGEEGERSNGNSYDGNMSTTSIRTLHEHATPRDQPSGISTNRRHLLAGANDTSLNRQTYAKEGEAKQSNRPYQRFTLPLRPCKHCGEMEALHQPHTHLTKLRGEYLDHAHSNGKLSYYV